MTLGLYVPVFFYDPAQDIIIWFIELCVDQKKNVC